MEDSYGSILFAFAYLAIIWIFLLIIIFKNLSKGNFKNRDNTWKWTFLAYLLLASGDAFHLGARIILFFMGISSSDQIYHIIIGTGYLVSGISMTYFYISIFHSWASLYGKEYSSPKKIKLYITILYAAFVLRLILLFLPYNQWFGGNPTVDFGFNFRIITAIPLYIIGIISVMLLFKDSNTEKKKSTGIDEKINRANFYASIWFLISYVCYSITLFLVVDYPITGMFMIPKTIAYIIAFFYHYKGILNRNL